MKLMILDGNSIINRAFYGVKPLTTRDGLPTNAVYGFLNILEHMEREEQPEAVCVAFDLHGPTFRHLRCAAYKATRRPMPEDLARQMPVIKQVLAAMNIPIYACQGWEADDVIGTVGRICSEQGWDCVIVTGDRDCLQLIDAYVRVKLMISRPGQTTATVYDEQRFREEYGFEPKKLIDLKALMGDSSDNIPGVAGVGQKTATDLLHKYGSLDGVYAHDADPALRPKLRELLKAGRENAYLSYELATIVPEAPIEFAPRDAIVKPYNRAELCSLFTRLEFTRLIDRYGLRGEQEEAPAPEAPQRSALPEGVDTAALCRTGDGMLAAAWEGGVCSLPPQARLPAHCICHDGKTLMHALGQIDVCFDTALAAYDLNPSQSDYPLSALARDYLGMRVDDGDAAACAQAAWALRPVLEAELDRQGMRALYTTIELPLCGVLLRMEQAGIAIDREQLAQFGAMLTQRIGACEQTIYDYAGGEFNINSPKQLGTVLFEKLGLPPLKKTKSGYSTNAEVLEKLKSAHPVVPAIMDYRMLAKLKSTYADGLLKVIGADGRIHTTFQNMVTATGRLSSTEPNLQNIPVRTDLGAEIRKMFIPREGCVLVDADYSQIELRVLAHIAGDEAMCAAFREGRDVHTATASQVFGVAPEAVTPLLRRRAKAVNFGIIYGMSEFSLAEDIGVSRHEARRYIDSYLQTFSGVREYREQVVARARADGYTTTLFGRRRYIPELKSDNFAVRQSGERIALNTPIQGTAADLIKLAMIRVDEALRAQYPSARLLLQVHDELIVECPRAIAGEVAALVSAQMEQVAQLSVPLVAQANWGESWYDAK